MATTSENGLWPAVRALYIQGPDAAQFLQGYLTSDTTQLASAGSIQATALCNVKGRVIASGWAVNTEQGIALVLHESVIERMRLFLKPYIAFSRCTLDPQDGWVSLSGDVAGRFQLVDGLNVTLSVPGVAPDNPASETACQGAAQALVQANFALISAPVSEQFLPQMLGLDASGAVDFRKGCYLGQEIVARAQFRGAVKRQLVRFAWDAQAPVVGQAFQSPSGTAVDTVISVAPGSGLGVSAAKSP